MIKTCIFLIVVFAANVIQAVTGFAGTLLAMPVSMALVGVNEAKVILNIMAFLSCLWISWSERGKIRWDILIKMVILMGTGMALGIWCFQNMSLDFLLPVYGIFIVLLACKKLFVKRTIHSPEWMLFLVLLLAGVIHGMFVSGGALLVIYASAAMKDKNEFRATVAPVWVILNIFLMVSDCINGYMTAHVMILAGLGVISLFAAVHLGNRLHQKMDQRIFMKLTYVLLLASGLTILL